MAQKQQPPVYISKCLQTDQYPSLSRWKLSTYVGDAKDYTGIYSAWTHAHDHACSHVQVFKR